MSRLLQIGESASFSKTVTEADICNYAGVTGDFNSAHIDREAAADGPFGERIAHGLLSAGFISTVLGTRLPGSGTIYLSQTLNFTAPVKIQDTITATVTVKEIVNAKKGIYRLDTYCENQHGIRVIDGEAVVKYPGSHAQPSENIKSEAAVHTSFYSEDELPHLGLKKYGSNVLISRNAVLYNPAAMEIGNNVRIDDFVSISGRVVLNDYIHIAQFCGLYGGEAGIYMDSFSGLSSKVSIYAASDDYSGNSLTNPTVPPKYKQTGKSLPVRLEKHVIIGGSSVILPGVTVGIGSSVGAMSLVSKSLDAWGVYAGNPVRRIKDRSQKLLGLENQLRLESDA